MHSWHVLKDANGLAAAGPGWPPFFFGRCRSTTFEALYRGIDPLANGDDGIQRVVIELPPNLSGPLDLNYSEFPNSCLAIQFP